LAHPIGYSLQGFNLLVILETITLLYLAAAICLYKACIFF